MRDAQVSICWCRTIETVLVITQGFFAVWHVVCRSLFLYQELHISLEDARIGIGERLREGVQSLWGKSVLEAP